MNRERMKELAQAQQVERIAQTRLNYDKLKDILSINERTYKLVINYRNAYQDDLVAARFSVFLEKYNYLVGDIAAGQLRIRGFYKNGTLGVSRKNQISSLNDYIYEFMNFGAPYFVLENLEPHFMEEEIDVSKSYYRKNKKHVYIEKTNFSNNEQKSVLAKENNYKRHFKIHDRIDEEN